MENTRSNVDRQAEAPGKPARGTLSAELAAVLERIRSGVSKGTGALRSTSEKHPNLATGFPASFLSFISDASVDADKVAGLSSRMSRHGLDSSDGINALPGDLARYGEDTVEQFLRQKDWSHVQSQKHHPELASDPGNAIWEDSSVNRARGATDMSGTERLSAELDNRFDVIQLPGFWEGIMGNTIEASGYAVVYSFCEKLLRHRDELLNGEEARKKEIFAQIVKESGLRILPAAAICVVLSVVVMIIPGASLLLIPLGLLGLCGLGLRTFDAVVTCPSQQEKQWLGAVRATINGASSG